MHRLILLFVFLTTISALSVHGQKEVTFQRYLDSITQNITSDSVQVDALNDLVWNKQYEDADLAVMFANESINRAKRIPYKYGEAVALEMRGGIHDDQGRYAEALTDLLTALDIWEEVGNPSFLISGNISLAILCTRWKDTARQFQYYDEAYRLEKAYGDGSGIPMILNNKGTIYNEYGDEEKAAFYFESSLKALDDLPEKVQAQYGNFRSNVMSNLAGLKIKQGNLVGAENLLVKALEHAKKYNYPSALSSIYRHMTRLDTASGNLDRAYDNAQLSLRYAKEGGRPTTLSDAYGMISKVEYLRGNYRSAFEYAEKQKEFNRILIAESDKALLTEMEAKYQFEKKELEIENQQLALDEQKSRINRQRTALYSAILIALLIGIIGLIYYSRYRLKKKTNSELSRKNEIIEAEKERSDILLRNILPTAVADELKSTGKTTAHQYSNVSVLFTDFIDFTKISEELSPDALVQKLDQHFREFDTIIEKHGLEKIKTIGDSYMACAGLPTPTDDHAIRTVRAALEIQEYLGKLDQKYQTDLRFQARCGIHSGSVIAGVVGKKKFAYDIWGDTVNVASRMESHGVAGKVNISEATYQLVKDEFDCTPRGMLAVKNKGKVAMYFVGALVP